MQGKLQYDRINAFIEEGETIEGMKKSFLGILTFDVGLKACVGGFPWTGKEKGPSGVPINSVKNTEVIPLEKVRSNVQRISHGLKPCYLSLSESVSMCPRSG